jgi:5-methylcytosine-specific restriction endonuclease McrA
MTKICGHCKIEKDISMFYSNKATKDNLSGNCKECKNQQNRKYEKENIEKIRLLKKKWRKNNPEKNLKSIKKSRLKKPDKYKMINRNHCFRTRARIKLIETDIDFNYLLKLKEEIKICSLCGTALNDIMYDSAQYNLDHIIPLSRKGTHSKDNIRYICRKCNLQKSNKLEKTNAI